MVESMAAGRQACNGQYLITYILIHKHRAEKERHWEWCERLKLQSPTPSDTPPLTIPIFPQQLHQSWTRHWVLAIRLTCLTPPFLVPGWQARTTYPAYMWVLGTHTQAHMCALYWSIAPTPLVKNASYKYQFRILVIILLLKNKYIYIHIYILPPYNTIFSWFNIYVIFKMSTLRTYVVPEVIAVSFFLLRWLTRWPSMFMKGDAEPSRGWREKSIGACPGAHLEQTSGTIWS